MVERLKKLKKRTKNYEDIMFAELSSIGIQKARKVKKLIRQRCKFRER